MTLKTARDTNQLKKQVIIFEDVTLNLHVKNVQTPSPLGNNFWLWQLLVRHLVVQHSKHDFLRDDGDGNTVAPPRQEVDVVFFFLFYETETYFCGSPRERFTSGKLLE